MDVVKGALRVLSYCYPKQKQQQKNVKNK